MPSLKEQIKTAYEESVKHAKRYGDRPGHEHLILEALNEIYGLLEKKGLSESVLLFDVKERKM